MVELKPGFCNKIPVVSPDTPPPIMIIFFELLFIMIEISCRFMINVKPTIIQISLEKILKQARIIKHC